MKQYIKPCLLLFINFLFWRGIFDNTINKFSNECEMTYMYEYPEYIEVNLENQNFDYKLYVYGEGKYAARLKKKVYKGIPVLFIPGNQGSSKQVRSLASVAYRMAQKYSTAYNFNYFAVDFNEEIGALFGPLLDRQTEFVEQSIKKILSLYQNEPNNPKSVILVGHSTGGLVARAVVSLPLFQSSLVSLIITEGTPHSRPVVIPDTSLKSFTERVDEFWTREKNLKLSNIVLVSIGGGKNDHLIPSILTSSKFADVDETLLSVPLCWLTTDHLAIVWCKQLVLAINRALFISVNTSTLQLSSDRNHIIQSFKDHLSQKLNSEIPPKTIEQKIKSHLEKKSDFVELTKLQSLKTFKNTFRSKMFLIPLTFAEKNRILSIVMKDVSPNSFVFSTKIDNGSDIIHVDYETVVQHRLRSIPKRRQEVNIDLKSIQIDNHTHVIAYAEPSNKQATFALDINDKYSHYARIEAPNFMSSFSPIVIMNQTPPNALSINITIENFIEYWQSYTLTLLPIGSCTANDGLPFVSLRSSWLDRWEYVIRRSNDSNEFVLGLDVPSPNPDHGQVQLHVVLDPSCTYSVRFQKSLRGIFDRISLLSVPQLPAFVVSQLLLILASQLKAVNDGSISSLNSQIAQLTPFSVVPLTKIFGMLLEKFPTIETDKSYLEKHRTNIAILPMLLFVSSIPLTIAASVFLKSLLYILSLCTRRFFYRNKSIVKENDDKVGILFFNYSSFFPILFLGIGMSTCSSLGLALALAFYFVKLLKIKCNINEKEVQQTQSLEKNKERTEHSEIEKSTSTESSNTQNSKELKTQALEKNKERTEHSEIEKSTTAESSNTQNSKELETHSTDAKNLKCNSNNLALNWYEIHLTLMTLLVIIFLLSIPSLITWFKSPRFPERLYPDSFLIPFIVMALSFEILWQVQFFKSGRFFKILNYVLKICSVSVIMFGSVHHYRINGIVSVVFAVLALHQAFEIS